MYVIVIYKPAVQSLFSRQLDDEIPHLLFVNFLGTTPCWEGIMPLIFLVYLE